MMTQDDHVILCHSKISSFIWQKTSFASAFQIAAVMDETEDDDWWLHVDSASHCPTPDDLDLDSAKSELTEEVVLSLGHDEQPAPEVVVPAIKFTRELSGSAPHQQMINAEVSGVSSKLAELDNFAALSGNSKRTIIGRKRGSSLPPMMVAARGF